MSDDDKWFDATISTFKASRWQLFLARLFGHRVVGEDMGCQCVGYQWRGTLYLTKFHKD